MSGRQLQQAVALYIHEDGGSSGDSERRFRSTVTRRKLAHAHDRRLSMCTATHMNTHET